MLQQVAPGTFREGTFQEQLNPDSTPEQDPVNFNFTLWWASGTNFCQVEYWREGKREHQFFVHSLTKKPSELTGVSRADYFQIIGSARHRLGVEAKVSAG